MEMQRSIDTVALAMGLLAVGLPTDSITAEPAVVDRTASLRGSFGTYAGQPRGKDRRVDVERLVAELAQMRANTYHWLIWHAATDCRWRANTASSSGPAWFRRRSRRRRQRTTRSRSSWTTNDGRSSSPN